MRALAVATAVVSVALVWGVLHVGWYAHDQIVDYPTYQKYGDAVVDRGAVPYRDFQLEYPPGALPTFIVPSLLPSADYQDAFQGLMALCFLVCVLCARGLAGDGAAALVVVAPLALGSLVLSRYDLWPTALAAAALLLLVRGRLTSSALLLGTAVAAKLWPAALVPLVLLWLWRSGRVADARRWLAVAVAATAAWFLPFVVLSPHGVAHSFHEQLARPLQLESLGGTVLIAAHHLFGTALAVQNSFGSQNLVGTGTRPAATLTSVAEALALCAVYAVFARGAPTVERLLVASAGAVAALVAFGKVFSPQYLVWLVVLVPLTRSAGARLLLFASLVLTQVYFPKRYWQLALGFHPAESWVVLARDVLVVALFATLAYATQRATASSSAAISPSLSPRSGARTSG